MKKYTNMEILRRIPDTNMIPTLVSVVFDCIKVSCVLHNTTSICIIVI